MFLRFSLLGLYACYFDFFLLVNFQLVNIFVFVIDIFHFVLIIRRYSLLVLLVIHPFSIIIGPTYYI